MTLDSKIQFRISTEQRERFHRAAQANRCSLTQFILLACEDRIKNLDAQTVSEPVEPVEPARTPNFSWIA